MIDRNDMINSAVGLISECLVPELISDIESTPCLESNFDEFKKNTNFKLIQLFDLIQYNKNFLECTEKDTFELRYKLVLLICEQTAVKTLFQIKDEQIQKNFQELSIKYFNNLLKNDGDLYAAILKYYHEKLKSQIWKKNIGAAHGFEQFCQMYFIQNEHLMDSKICTFSLSVGLLFEEFYDPSYKAISFRLFCIILHRTPQDIIINSNIDGVIYERAFKNTSKLSKTEDIKVLWNCLYKCIYIKKKTDFSQWSAIDDLLENLIQSIAFENSTDNFIVLLLQIPKICFLNKNLEDIIENFNECDNLLQFNKYQINQLREYCGEIKSFASYRWVKKILELFVAESNRLLIQNSVVRILCVMHICYLVCIFPIPTKICKPHLLKFLQKFLPVLLESAVNNNDSIEIFKEFLNTICIHLNKSKEGGDQLEEFKKALDLILSHRVFS